MLKNISICFNVLRSHTPHDISHFVKNVISSAKYKGQLQFIFYCSSASKDCKNVINELYMKYHPDLFDPCPLPTIKAVNSGKSDSWINDCLKYCDAPVVVKKDRLLELIEQYGQDFDQKYLEETIDGISQKEFHHLQLQE